MADVGANRLQAFQYVGRDLHRLTAVTTALVHELAHPPKNNLAQNERRSSVPSRPSSLASEGVGPMGISVAVSRSAPVGAGVGVRPGLGGGSGASSASLLLGASLCGASMAGM